LKRFAGVLVLLALASPASASGVALRWGSCEGTANRNFACDRSTGSELLVGSFDPPSGIANLSGMEVILRITSADGSVPSWWQMYMPGSCRRSSVSAAFDMSDQMDCDDPWSGQAIGGIALWEADATGINVKMAAAVAPSAMGPVSSGRTYAGFKLIINHQRSSGAGACGGCDAPMCIKIEAIRLTDPGRLIDANSHKWESKYWDLTDGITGMGGSTQVATWQGGTSNCAAGLSKPSTWAELKARFKSK
jgi:hypothetical protein